MKKIFLIAAVALFTASTLTLVSCKDDEQDEHPAKFVGTWEATSLSFSEYDYEKNQYGESYSLIGETSRTIFTENAPVLILNANGTYEQIQTGEEAITGKWAWKDLAGGILTTVRSKTNEKAEFKTYNNFEDGFLTLERFISIDEATGIAIMENYTYKRK